MGKGAWLQLCDREAATILNDRAAGKGGGSPLFVAGDCNAPRRAGGYSRTTRKGDNLSQAAANRDLTLVTDSAFPTRIGNSCSRDTAADLTFLKNVGAVSWHNLNEDLGSDHNVLATRINVNSKPLREFTMTDWDHFRKIRKERAPEQGSAIDLDRWAFPKLVGAYEDIDSGILLDRIITEWQRQFPQSFLYLLIGARNDLLAYRWHLESVKCVLLFGIIFCEKTHFDSVETVRFLLSSENADR
ncbi:hypothetical protein HPB50_023837 [Hyalomma asiaticum]|uniref:Uncharacterized protein n=1 Tax=Hyalomma asiaticum TaxID=266040 RepID=A0ACB7S4V8_HYAAI|nr:hypothetical protein HPB50_023837 [Hyalomma asiaticum]